MANAQKGSDFLLKDGTGTGATTIAALRSVAFSIDNKSIDVTTRDSSGIRELLGSAGVSSMQVQANGIFSDATDITNIFTRALNKSNNLYSVVWGNGDKYEGQFQVAKAQAAGEYDGEQTYDLTLDNANAGTFTPV